MPITLATIPDGSTSYEAITEANRVMIESFLNELEAKVSAAGGDGAVLILDAFDRDGLVGGASYQLDVKNYTGGPQIKVGRRPVFSAAKGDQDLSIAFGTFGGLRQRVTLNGDVTLDASAIVSALPKTIYVGIPSDGTPQLYQDGTLPNVLYAYSMTWNGFSLTDFKHKAHILPGFTLIQELAKAPSCERIFDSQTDWFVHEESRSTMIFGGNGDTSETGLNVSREIVGGFFATGPADDDGWAVSGGPNSTLKLELWDDQDRRWNLEDIAIDVATAPTRFFFTIDPVLGDDRWVTDVTEFRLVKISAGGDVVGARGFSWGLFTRPVIGTPIAKDSAVVDTI